MDSKTKVHPVTLCIEERTRCLKRNNLILTFPGSKVPGLLQPFKKWCLLYCKNVHCFLKLATHDQKVL